jgi:hypothetical protein
MNIQGAFRDLSESFKSYSDTTQQATAAVVLKFRELRSDPDFYQKTCQVAFASLQLIIMHYPGAASLSRLSFVLQTYGMHDFYRFIQQPRHWFFPINSEAINEFVVLDDLAAFIYQQSRPVELEEIVIDEVMFDDETHGKEIVDVEEDEVIMDEEIDIEEIDKLKALLKPVLKAQLELMASKNDAYRNLDEFKEVIKKRLRKIDEQKFEEYDFAKINIEHVTECDLSDLNEHNRNYHVSQWIRHVPLLERIMNLNWAIVDIGCVGLYLQGWHLLDTAKCSDRIGEVAVFQWVKNYQLDTWVIGLVCTGFAWKFLESVRKLSDDALTPQERRQARWNAVTSLAEVTLYSTIFANHIGKTQFNNAYLQWLAIASKSLGLLSIVTRPKHEFFQRPEVAPAA